MRRKQIRCLAVAGLLVLVLGSASSAAATPASLEVGTWSAVARQLAGWWSALWTGDDPRSASAASEGEAYPDLDPNGPQVSPADDAGESLTGTEDDPPSTEAYPNLDPDG